MPFNLSIDGKQTECKIEETKLIFSGNTNQTVDAIDIIKVEDTEDSAFKIHVINKSKSPKWSVSVIRVSGESESCRNFLSEIKELTKSVSPKPRKFLVMINPVGGKQSGVKSYRNIVAPIFDLANITTEVIVSERPKHVIDVMTTYNFSETDGIVLCGGDGTYHECVATLLRRFQNEAGIDINDIDAPIKPLTIPVAMIPTGTGNVIAGTNYGSDDIATAALHIVRGQIKKRCVCSYFEYGRFLTYAGQSFSYGLFTDMLYKMNTTRWLKGRKRMVIPLYYLMFKRHREFQVEIEYTNSGKRNPESDKKKQNAEESTMENRDEGACSTNTEDVNITKTTETLRGNYIAAVAFIDDMTDADFTNLARLMDTNCTAMMFYKRSGRFDLASHFKGIASRSPNAFQRSFLDNIKFTGFKFKIINDGQDRESDSEGKKRLIAVDGEIVEISGNEFECRWHKDVVPVYCSF